jgi:hypothetical protein
LHRRFGTVALLLALALGLCPHPAGAANEFLLNDDRVDRNQWSPRAALGKNGMLVVAWMDGRNISGAVIDYDIYAMTIPDPLGLGSSLNRRVNDDSPGPVQGFPDIAGSPAGTFLCVWEDARSGNRDIYAAALDSVGFPLGRSLRVNDDTGTADQLVPRVVTTGTSGYLVVWGDGREKQGEVYASYRSTTGAPLGVNRRITTDPVAAGSFQGEPTVAWGKGGRTLVVWLDGREGAVVGAATDVYGQWLDASGASIGGNFKISTPAAGHCASPTVAADSTFGYVVAWIDRRDSPGDPGDVYTQRFDVSGNLAGGNVRVNDDPPGRDQRRVFATAGPGAAAVLWEDFRGSLGIDSNVEGSFVPYDSSPPSANFRVNTDLPGRQGAPGAIWDGRDAFLTAWEDGRRGSPDIMAISLLSDGTRRGSDTQLNDDAAPFDQSRARLGHGPGRYVATWTDRRNQTPDLYAQWVNAAGGRDGVNHVLWSSDGATRATWATGGVSKAGTAIVAAQIARDSDAGDIVGFWYPAPGAPPSGMIGIGDVLPSAQSTPVAAASDSGFAAVWLDGREGSPRLYGQRFSISGAPIGSNHPILSIEPSDPVHALDVAGDPDGGYWLAYAEGFAQDQRLWLIPLSPDLVPTDAPLSVSPGIPGPKDEPSVGVAEDGRVEVAWLGLGPEGYGRVYHQAFAPGPSALAAGTVEAELGRPAGAPTVAVAGSGAIVTWEERGSLGDWSIWMQRFSGGLPSAPPLRVDEDLTGSDQMDPRSGFDASGHAVVVWTDFRSASSGSDILGRAFSFAPTAAENPPPDPPPPTPAPPPAPRAPRIGPVQPNPFSSVMATPVEVPSATPARVTVWNAQGQRVATLWNGGSPAERFTLRWDGRDDRGRQVASGVYWITVESGGVRRGTRVVHLR